VNVRTGVFVALAVALAGLFVRLGFWQLDRRAERQRANAFVRAQMQRPPVPYPELIRKSPLTPTPKALLVDTALAPWWRRTTIVGKPEYAEEFVVMGRSRNGSPGVHIFTPLRVDGLKEVVLVNRGWVYSPDAATIDLTRWRENRDTFTGYTEQLPWGHSFSIVKGRGIRPLYHNGVSRVLPYSFQGLYVVALDSGGPEAPARLSLPSLSDGPHLSYAIQWFCFAAIALGGAVIVWHKARRA
jgi:surfeit locus 1 family protein